MLNKKKKLSVVVEITKDMFHDLEVLSIKDKTKLVHSSIQRKERNIILHQVE